MPRHAPKRYQSASRSPAEQESRVARRGGGKRVAGSGASMYSKGDVRGVQAHGIEFLTECKQTIHGSISVKWNWLAKITREADAQQCEPALAIEIRGGADDAITDRDWILIPMRVFEKLKNAE